MKKPERIELKVEDDLKKHAVSILRRVNQAEQGGLLFLLNPSYALEEAGFDLSPWMKTHLRRALSLGTEAKAELRTLEAQINDLAGKEINPGSDMEVEKFLFEDLKLEPPGRTPAKKGKKGVDSPAPKTPPQRVEITPDLLQGYQDAHPAIAPIIQARQVLSSGWKFVDRETFEKVKNGASVTLLRSVRFTRQQKDKKD